VCAGPDTYTWRLVQNLVTWATKGDKQEVNGLCNDILGWTNHIADVSQTILTLCPDKHKKE